MTHPTQDQDQAQAQAPAQAMAERPDNVPTWMISRKPVGHELSIRHSDEDEYDIEAQAPSPAPPALPRRPAEHADAKPTLPSRDLYPGPPEHSSRDDAKPPLPPRGGHEDATRALPTRLKTPPPEESSATDDDDDPAPYDEAAVQRLEAAHAHALEDLDLNATTAYSGPGRDDKWAGGSLSGSSSEVDLSEPVKTGTAPAAAAGDADVPEGHHRPSRWATFAASTKTAAPKLKAAYTENAPKVKAAYQTNAPKVQAAYVATAHWAGGVLGHPVQSTAHYSVLRHGTGLVPYRGLGTRVVITIFADDPLALDGRSHNPSSSIDHPSASAPHRTIYLQQRGWSGQRGMRLKTALGRTAEWRDVTPQARVAAGDVNAEDERAWQRDIATFLRKAHDAPKFAHRQPVETCLVRIPAAAADGYFRLVICDARQKILCPSPVFRVASLSTSSASFKGASLATMPLEIGIKGLTAFAMDAATGGAAPLLAVVQNRFGSWVPGLLTRGASYAQSAVGKMDGRMVNSASVSKRPTYDPVQGDGSGALNEAVVLGSDAGPENPYPIRFSGTVVRGRERSNVETGLPTANLHGVRDEVKTRLAGVFFGWASIASKTITSDHWRPCLIWARPPEHAPGVAPKTVIRVFVIEDLDGVAFYDATMSVLVMGFLRPWAEMSNEDFKTATGIDVLVARQSLLDRPAWQPEATLKRVKEQASLADRWVETRQKGQRQIGRVPFDKLAIRTSTAAQKDAVVGKGGLCIDRRSSG